MALTTEQRDEIPKKHFAVPETEQLPIEDVPHVKMAWKMVDKTKGLSASQRVKARENILKRAKDLGVDTSGWEDDLKADADEDENQHMEELEEQHELRLAELLQGQAKLERKSKTGEHVKVQFAALAMTIPDQPTDHPNQIPFSGILTRIDEPSDLPPNGSGGKRVLIPKAVAETALPSLLGMGIDMTPDFDGHNAKFKIGVITQANIVGDAIEIAGFFYGADFPNEVKRIQAEKGQLGFSYEAQAFIQSMDDNPLIMKSCVFTGAAVLYKDLAAYQTTSISASKNKSSEIIMNDELKAFLEKIQASVDGVVARIDKVEASAAEREEQKKVEAGSLHAMIKPHADALRACADGMMAAGIGAVPKVGHGAILHSMADDMEADAVQGKMPTVYQTGDFWHASKDAKESTKVAAAASEEMKALTSKIDSMTTQITDLTKKSFDASAEPERKTLTPAVIKLLSKAGINDENSDGKFSLNDIDKKLQGMTVNQRLQAKMELQNAGKIAN